MRHKDWESGFEEFLNEFGLRRPNALPKFARRPAVLQRVAAAAGVFVGCGISLWILSRTPTENRKSASPIVVADAAGSFRRISAIALTRLASEDAQAFEAELSAASRNSLPNFRRQDSALQVLARE